MIRSRCCQIANNFFKNIFIDGSFGLVQFVVLIYLIDASVKCIVMFLCTVDYCIVAGHSYVMHTSYVAVPGSSDSLNQYPDI